MNSENQNTITFTDEQIKMTKLDKDIAKRFFKEFCSLPAKQQSMIASGAICMAAFGKEYRKIIYQQVVQEVEESRGGALVV